MFCVTRNTVSQSQNQFYSIERPTYKEKETMKTRKLLVLVLVVMLLSATLTACDWHWPWTPLNSGSETTIISEKSNSVVVDVDATYYYELSCSDLPSCPTKVVPSGMFAIGYKNTGTLSCDYFIFRQGEEINYDIIDEFFMYNGALPKTTEDSFARSQTSFIYACTH